jgi:hypothetical protein
MTPSEKITYVSQQIVDIRAGHTKSLECPYCRQFNHPDQEICCETLKRCVKAIMDHEDTVMEIKLQEAIAEACSVN